MPNEEKLLLGQILADVICERFLNHPQMLSLLKKNKAGPESPYIQRTGV